MTNDNLAAAIRRATLHDAATLSALGTATFTETFGHLYPPEDLRGFLLESHSEQAWARTLADPNRAVLLAELVDKTPTGYILVGPCKLPIENREASAGEIQQLYVLARYHNLRLGSRLLELGLEWLRAQSKSPLYIGVWSENYGAQRLYGRHGFTKVGEYGFRVGNTVDREFILKR